jgi:HPt (histidine-containing phosphotransfer) domain-containing protein
MADEVIDQTVFDELKSAAGDEFVAELVGTFLEEAPGMLAELRAARAAVSVDRFRRAAHSLKSNALTFGATALAAQARAIELQGLGADAAADGVVLDALDAAYAQAASALKALSHG